MRQPYGLRTGDGARSWAQSRSHRDSLIRDPALAPNCLAGIVLILFIGLIVGYGFSPSPAFAGTSGTWTNASSGGL
jgi:hypothetical protein